jgi:hypothetical protein
MEFVDCTVETIETMRYELRTVTYTIHFVLNYDPPTIGPISTRKYRVETSIQLSKIKTPHLIEFLRPHLFLQFHKSGGVGSKKGVDGNWG